MRELLVRLCLLSVGFGASFAESGSDVATNAGIAGVLAALAVFSYLLERREMRDGHAATVFAGLDGAGIALWLAANGELSRYGVAVLAPLIWAAAKDGLKASTLAPIASASIIAANVLAGRLPMLSTSLLAPAALVLGLGFLLDVVPAAGPRLVERPAPEPPLSLTGDDYIELRESYRVLRQRFRDLERRGEHDRLIAKLFEMRQRPAAELYPALAEMIADTTGADGVAILSVAQTGEAMVVRGATTDFPNELSERAFSFDPSLAPRDLRLRLDGAVRAVPAAERRDFANVLLLHGERVLGMICLGQADAESLQICRDKMDPLAPYVSTLLAEEIEREEAGHRLAHAEMLFDLAVISGGDPASAAERMATRLSAAVDADGLAISSLSKGDGQVVAAQGANLELIDALKFSGGTGAEGWAKAGYPEVLILDARDDAACPSEIAIRRRIGSFCLVPIRSGETVTGFLSAATHRAGGIDVAQAETLRLGAQQVASVLASLVSEDKGSKGVLSEGEFKRFLSAASGSLVVLEVLHRDQLALTAGKTALDAAIRRLQVRLRKQLSEEAAMCRRSNGDFLAFLTGTSEAEAQAWANDAATLAALIGVPRIDGAGSTPLAIRAKVAQIAATEASDAARFAA